MLFNVLEAGILEMNRQHKGQAFPAVEVIQWIYPEDWPHFKPELYHQILELQALGKVKLSSSESANDSSSADVEKLWIQVI